MAALCISLDAADRPLLVREVVQLLRSGALCVLPTETVYGLAALPSVPAARQRLQALKGRAADREFTLHVASRDAAAGLAQLADPRVRRMVERYWPGPLTLVLRGTGGGDVGLRVPAHDFTREVLQQLAEPVWLTSVNRSGQAPLCEPAAIAREFGGQLACIVDDGPSPLGTASTVVRCTGPALEVLREGILSHREVLQTAAALVLFVCTGNTCRSPLAEALARRVAAQALGIAAPELLARGLWFASAGISTMDGMPASDGSVTVGSEVGLDLQPHRSTALTDQMVDRAAQIVCLSHSHLEAVVEGAPAAAGRTILLRPDGSDIADPYGRSVQDYRRARDDIATAVQARLAGWLDLLPAP